ncbi:hypothetical protein BG28_11785 [Nesterenkonia sp. AN1]|nr:hypothetical protein BG28_11785 [Nesterenkonia sp. AN1]
MVSMTTWSRSTVVSMLRYLCSGTASTMMSAPRSSSRSTATAPGTITSVSSAMSAAGLAVAIFTV